MHQTSLNQKASLQRRRSRQWHCLADKIKVKSGYALHTNAIKNIGLHQQLKGIWNPGEKGDKQPEMMWSSQSQGSNCCKDYCVQMHQVHGKFCWHFDQTFGRPRVPQFGQTHLFRNPKWNPAHWWNHEDDWCGTLRIGRKLRVNVDLNFNSWTNSMLSVRRSLDGVSRCSWRRIACRWKINYWSQ